MTDRPRKVALRLAKRALGERYGAAKHTALQVRMRLGGRDPEVDLARRFIAANGSRVLDGPFRGMRYVNTVTGHKTSIPKLLGCYEEELHPYLDRLLEQDASEIVDIGSAEGYYAVGLALRRPTLEVIAYDGDPVARHLVRRMARLNGVSVEVRGHCTPESLKGMRDGALVVCDCEGFEKVLLDPASVPSLLTASIVVEVHDLFDPEISAVLRSRFRATHDISVVRTRDRRPEDYPSLAGFEADEARLAVSEFRPAPMEWFVMTPLPS